jgi:hypothetical protein
MQQMGLPSHPLHTFLEAIGQFRFLVSFLPPATARHNSRSFVQQGTRFVRMYIHGFFDHCMQCWESGWNPSIVGLGWPFIVGIIVTYFFLFFIERGITDRRVWHHHTVLCDFTIHNPNPHPPSTFSRLAPSISQAVASLNFLKNAIKSSIYLHRSISSKTQ